MDADQADAETVGDFLRLTMDAKGLSQKDLAFVLGVPAQLVSQLVTNKRGVNASLSKALGQVLGVPAGYLLSLQKTVELRDEIKRAKEPDSSVARKARLVATYPVREMIKRGWLRDDPESLEEQVAKFFGIKSATEAPTLAHAAYKTGADSVTPEQLGWLYRVKQLAEDMLAPTFDDASVGRAIARLDKLLFSAEEIRQVPRILAECGIRFVIVEQLPGAKIDGVCFWLNGNAPVIGMSLRYDRIDNFWFVLRHELEHVRLRHGLAAPMLDTELEGENAGTGEAVSEEERLANAAAAEFCVPQAKLTNFIARKAPYLSERNIIAFARTMSVHPGLVAGQLQRHTGRYELFRKHQVKIRSIVAPNATVDGWGDVAPIGDEYVTT